MKLTHRITQNLTPKLNGKLPGKLASLALLAISAPVYAHSGHGLGSTHGLLHIEHILTLLAVGILVVAAFASHKR